MPEAAIAGGNQNPPPLPIQLQHLAARAALQGLRFLVRLKLALTWAFRIALIAPYRFLARILGRIGLPFYHRWLRSAARTRRAESAGLRSAGLRPWVLPLAAGILVSFVAVPNVINQANAGTTGSNSLLAKITQGENAAEIVETAKVKARAPARLAAVGSGGIGGVEGETEPTIGDFTFSTAISADDSPAVAGGTSDTLPLRTEPVEYTIAGGDTVSLIAAKFGLGYKSILWSNGIDDRSIIKPGNVLHIPPTDGVLHTMAKGENLATLVTKYSADLAGTLEVNHLPDPSAVQVGQVVTLVSGQPPAEAAPAPVQRRTAFIDVAPDTGPTGTGPIGRRVGGSGFLWPTTDRRINQYFRGYRHTGVDIDGDYSSPIFAAADGRVEQVLFERYGYGYHVIINHGGGRETLYGHASKVFVRPGQRVDRGQTIAMVGSTGRSTGTHLHFEIILSGVKVNPLPYL